MFVPVTDTGIVCSVEPKVHCIVSAHAQRREKERREREGGRERERGRGWLGFSFGLQLTLDMGVVFPPHGLSGYHVTMTHD